MSIYQHLIDRNSNLQELLLKTKYDNLSLIPCDMDLAGCEIEMAKDEDHLIRLRNIIQPFKDTDPADYMLMDCCSTLRRLGQVQGKCPCSGHQKTRAGGV